MRRILGVSLLAVVSMLVPVSAEAATVTVETQDNKFVPADAPLAAGDTVVFKNTGKAPHNVKSKDGSVNIPLINAGEEKTAVVGKAGDIAYVCTFHETLGMKGTLRVAAAGAAGAAPPAAAPTPAAPPTPKAEEDRTETSVTNEEKVAKKPKKGEEAEETAAEAPPSQKYFPTLALGLLLLLGPLVGMAYRKLMKTPAASGGGSPPAAPPA